jgi:hypothetical protein
LSTVLITTDKSKITLVFDQQFPLMTCESYATMVGDSSVRVSTIHFRLMQRFS